MSTAMYNVTHVTEAMRERKRAVIDVHGVLAVETGAIYMSA